MKFLILALFVTVAVATPNEEDSNGPVELIVNGVPEGEPLDLSDIVDIKVKEHVNGAVASTTNLLHPYTAVGIAEAAAAAAAAEIVVPEPVVLPAPAAPEVSISADSEVVVPEPVVLPAPVAPEVILPEPVVLPAPVAPEVVVPEPVVLPAPVAPEVVIPEPVVLPAPVAPEVVLPEPVVLPAPVAPEVIEPVPASLPNGEIFNDGTVSVTVNTPQEAGVFSTITSWFSMVMNYFNNGAQTTQQII